MRHGSRGDGKFPRLASIIQLQQPWVRLLQPMEALAVWIGAQQRLQRVIRGIASVTYTQVTERRSMSLFACDSQPSYSALGRTRGANARQCRSGVGAETSAANRIRARVLSRSGMRRIRSARFPTHGEYIAEPNQSPQPLRARPYANNQQRNPDRANVPNPMACQRAKEAARVPYNTIESP